MVPEPAAPDGSFARRLNHVWSTVHPGGRKPYSLDEVAQGVRALGCEVSLGYLANLRSGARSNPSLQLVQALAKFFGVPASYFLDDEEEERVNAELEVLAAMRDQGIRNLALRAQGLTAGDVDTLTAVAASLRQARGIDEPDMSKE